jgi:hypothetical protein
MRVFLKSVGTGLFAAVAVAFLVILIQFAASAVIVEWQRPTGSGGIGSVSAGLPVLAPLLGFVAGFWFQFRRNRVRPLVP